MSGKIIFAPLAREEFEDAAAWYESERAGLSEEFKVEVRQMLAQISKSPERFRLASPTTRKATLRRFPYSIFYSIEPNSITIVSIFHGARNPAQLRRRLK